MRILCLEDDELVARSLGRILHFLGHDHVLVTTCDAALEKLASGGFDAVIADCRIGANRDGQALLEQVAREHPHVVRILTSGSEPPASFSTADPRQHFLPKPFMPDDVSRVLGAAAHTR